MYFFTLSLSAWVSSTSFSPSASLKIMIYDWLIDVSLLAHLRKGTIRAYFVWFHKRVIEINKLFYMHNQRWPLKKRQEKLSLPRPLKWKFSSQNVQLSSFPSQENNTKKIKQFKNKNSRSDFFNNEGPLVKSKCGFIS